ncbi:hypothetical protein [Kineococcus indalonis]|uniref:hypothetical protein n=1 Tax=Kineococcus indalonis TaxID=2696566 RepID=UPI001411EDBD|nr:hypothetical protein [Kineococcus indalonis]NAZ87670.1 hypothetical protein [Kineococcus indalonis]
MSGASAPRWSGTGLDRGFDDGPDGGPGGAREDEREGFEDERDGWSGDGFVDAAQRPVDALRAWVFRLLLPVAASPVLLCATALQRVFDDAAGASPDPEVAVVFADRWSGALRWLQPGWACAVTALLVLLLAGAVAAGLPRWSVPTEGDRTAVAVLAVGCAAVSAVTAAVSLAVLLQQPTDLQAWYARFAPSPVVPLVQWAVDGALHVAAVLLAAVAAVLCRAPARSRR